MLTFVLLTMMREVTETIIFMMYQTIPLHCMINLKIIHHTLIFTIYTELINISNVIVSQGADHTGDELQSVGIQSTLLDNSKVFAGTLAQLSTQTDVNTQVLLKHCLCCK